MAGRHSKLTPEAILAITDKKRIGAPDRVAAEAGGISVQTLLTWKRQGAEEYKRRDGKDAGRPRLGRRELEGLAKVPIEVLSDPLDGEKLGPLLLLSFFEEFTRARAEGVVSLLSTVRMAALPHDEVEESVETWDVMRKDGTVVTLSRTVTKRKKGAADWRAAQWLLSVMEKDLFGTQGDGFTNGPMWGEFVALLSPEQFARLQEGGENPMVLLGELIAEAQAGGPAEGTGKRKRGARA